MGTASKWKSKEKVPGVRYRIRTAKQESRLRKVCEKERRSKCIGGKKQQGKRNAAVCRTTRTSSWTECRSREAVRRVQVL